MKYLKRLICLCKGHRWKVDGVVNIEKSNNQLVTYKCKCCESYREIFYEGNYKHYTPFEKSGVFDNH